MWVVILSLGRCRSRFRFRGRVVVCRGTLEWGPTLGKAGAIQTVASFVRVWDAIGKTPQQAAKRWGLRGLGR